LCKAPRKLPMNASKFQIWKYQRDELLIRLIYETFARISELLKVDISDVDIEQHAIHIKHPKSKAVFRVVDGKRKHIDSISRPRWAFFSNYTRDFIIRFLDGRKKGPLIINSSGKRLSSRGAERIVDHYARSIDIQKIIGYSKNGREIRLVTCKALRESGERHTDINGGDRDATARVAGHTVATKEKHYKLGNFEEDRAIVRNHHPSMKMKNNTSIEEK
ncbi:MAG: tyrosine-type recombinase/integrase, partial [Thermoplasmata archaeon]|nr:tyrosine-type recombinase/integrase [Thermoplasmata archaeon]